MIRADQTVDGIREAYCTGNCLKKLTFQNTFSTDMNARISSARTVRKKDLTKKFISLLGYSMMCTRVTTKHFSSIAHKAEQENKNASFWKRPTEIQRFRIKYGFWRAKKRLL